MDFISYINNAALLLLLSLLSINIQSRWVKPEPGKSIVLGCLYGLSAALAMNIPMVLQPGVIFDGRSVVLSLAGLFTGNFTTAIACLIAAVVRINIGGPGRIHRSGFDHHFWIVGNHIQAYCGNQKD